MIQSSPRKREIIKYASSFPVLEDPVSHIMIDGWKETSLSDTFSWGEISENIGETMA